MIRLFPNACLMPVVHIISPARKCPDPYPGVIDKYLQGLLEVGILLANLRSVGTQYHN